MRYNFWSNLFIFYAFVAPNCKKKCQGLKPERKKCSWYRILIVSPQINLLLLTHEKKSEQSFKLENQKYIFKVYPVSNALNKCLDIKLSRTTLLARSIFFHNSD